MSDPQELPEPTLIWSPDVLENVSSIELELYLQFSATTCIPGGGCNVEEALDILYKCQGNIKEATKKLLMRETKEVAVWTLGEVQTFELLLKTYRKNFLAISRDLKTKSVKDCVEFYYIWKNEIQSKQRSPPHHYHYIHQTSALISQIKHEVQHISQHQQQHPMSLLQPQQQPQHFEQLPNAIIPPQHDQAQELKPDEEQFPCKVCGRIFLKIKSRSAHMKRHKNERLYNLS